MVGVLAPFKPCYVRLNDEDEAEGASLATNDNLAPTAPARLTSLALRNLPRLHLVR